MNSNVNLRSKTLSLLAVMVTIILLSSIAGCASEHKDQTKNFTQEWIGSRISISKPPLNEEDPGTKISYNVGSDGVFRGYYELINHHNEAHSYAVSMLLNFRQVSFFFNGKTGTTHFVRLKPGETKAYPIIIEDIPAGLSDLAVLLFWDPNNNSDDEEFRLNTATSYFTGDRVNLIRGSEAAQAASILRSPDLLRSTLDENGNAWDGASVEAVMVNQKANDYGFWLSTKVSAGQNIDCYIHLINPAQEPANYVFTPLFEYKSAPLAIGQPPEPVYASVGPGQVQTFKTSFAAPKKPGVYDYYVIAIKDPNKKVSETEMATSTFLNTSRVAIVVK